jgi:parallel beta-helix repeat protein
MNSWTIPAFLGGKHMIGGCPSRPEIDRDLRSGEPGDRMPVAKRMRVGCAGLRGMTKTRAIMLASLFLGVGFATLLLSCISSSAYVSHSPILITSNAMFDGDHGVTGGSGVAGDPWVISNWDIGGDASDAIVIRNTTAHFVIRGVYVHASTFWNDKTGVHMYNVTNGSVEASVIEGEFDFGVHLEYCSDCSIVSSNFTDVDYESGVCVEYSANVTISGNQLSNCGYTIRLVELDSCTVSNNTVRDELSYPGIQLYNVVNATISDNYVHTVYQGMQIAGSGTANASVTGNTVMNCTQIGIGVYSWVQSINISSNHLEYTGIGIQQCDGAVVSGNRFLNVSTGAIGLALALNTTIVGNEMGASGIYIQGNVLREYNTHVISTDNTVNGRPVRYVKDATGLSLDGLETGQMIMVNCTNTEVRNVSAVDAYKGMDVAYSRHILVRDCNLSGNYYSGLDVRTTENITVSHCEMSDAEYYGVLSTGYLKNATFSNNTVARNDNCGLKIWYATQVDIRGSTIVANGLPAHQYGIELYQCTRGNVTENHIADNYAGMVLSTGTVNFNVFHNNFINNTYQVWDVMSNAWDDGYPSGGNYWDNYTGTDGNGDGIGDTPYVIDADSQDNYPLMDPIPEFSDIAVPVVLVLGLVIVVARLRSRTRA